MGNDVVLLSMRWNAKSKAMVLKTGYTGLQFSSLDKDRLFQVPSINFTIRVPKENRFQF
jgi:hypothetical protein